MALLSLLVSVQMKKRTVRDQTITASGAGEAMQATLGDVTTTGDNF